MSRPPRVTFPWQRAPEALVFVLPAERLPITETRKAVTLPQHRGVPLDGLVVNRSLPSLSAEQPSFAARQEQAVHYLEEIEATFPELKKLRMPFVRREVVGKDALTEVPTTVEATLGQAEAGPGDRPPGRVPGRQCAQHRILERVRTVDEVKGKNTERSPA